MVDAVDSALGGPAGQLGNGQAGTEPDLEHAVGGPDVEQVDHPEIALPIGGAMGHHEAGQMSGPAVRPVKLPDGPADHALLERIRSHDRQSTASSALEVKPVGEPMTIGELARATGVSTSALRYWEAL